MAHMRVKGYRVRELARIARVTVRTLHHYDGIGLLVPSARTAAGYRLYGEPELQRLQQILLWRELGLSLESIRQLLDDPEFDRRRALLLQREELSKHARRAQALIRAVDAALGAIEGGTEVDAKDLFDGFDPTRHEDEARERWAGTNAFAEAARRTKCYSKEDWARIHAAGDAVLEALAEKMREGAKPTDAAVVALAERHRRHIDRWFYPCSHGMHRGLAELYVADERFAASIDRHGAGLTGFLADAVHANAARD